MSDEKRRYYPQERLVERLERYYGCEFRVNKINNKLQRIDLYKDGKRKLFHYIRDGGCFSRTVGMAMEELAISYCAANGIDVKESKVHRG